jgi:hypothetical protein
VRVVTTLLAEQGIQERTLGTGQGRVVRSRAHGDDTSRSTQPQVSLASFWQFPGIGTRGCVGPLQCFSKVVRSRRLSILVRRDATVARRRSSQRGHRSFEDLRFAWLLGGPGGYLRSKVEPQIAEDKALEHTRLDTCDVKTVSRVLIVVSKPRL